MRRSLALLTAVALPLVASASYAAMLTDTGKIKALDAKTHQITLQDGKHFTVPATWDFAAYKVGEKVTVTYDVQKGKMNASTVVAAK